MISLYYELMQDKLFGSIPFISGVPPARPELLARHLPPIPEGMVSSWLEMNVPRGTWILDPFGASPRIALEAARAGYRVLVAANNPIVRFLLEMQAAPPRLDDLKAALSELAASYVGEERIEPHIRSLYNTVCARCGQTISAEAFLWEHGNPTPYVRMYTCQFCGDTGEHPSTAFDAEQTGKFSSSGIHKARALERVVAFNDQDRVHVEQALSVYTPRAVYALITIINKLQGLNLTSIGRKYLSALLLYTFDQANSMWRPQGQVDRRRQLTIPRHSREANVWCILEEGITRWGVDSVDGEEAAVPVSVWPNLPPSSSGICIFEGRLAGMIEAIRDIEIHSVCTAIPRPNLAYWTLSALWAGWLWGREAVGAFKSVLHRQRYDWAWHANALASVFKHLANFLPPSTNIFGMLGETEPGFIGSALVAAGISGCRLEGIALRAEEKLAQITWKTESGREVSRLSVLSTQAAIQSARRYIEACGEPVYYLNTLSAALNGVVQSWHSEPSQPASDKIDRQLPLPEPPQLPSKTEPTPAVIYSSLYNSVREALSFRSGFLRYNLQGEEDVEASTGSLSVQSTLFSDDIGKALVTEDEAEEVDVTLRESGNVPEKERATRSSEVSDTTLLWLRETGQVSPSTLTDRYETFLLSYLQEHPSLTLGQLDRAMCLEFPGLFSPAVSFIHLCLDSYAVPDPQLVDAWSLRPEDDRFERSVDLVRIHAALLQVGKRLEFETEDRVTSSSVPYVTWTDRSTGKEYRFFITPTVAVGEIIIHGEQPVDKGYIVFPASRANMWIYKLRRDPRLARAFNPSQGTWHILKFRHLRSLAESPLLQRENLDQMLGLDPLTFSTPQLWLV